MCSRFEYVYIETWINMYIRKICLQSDVLFSFIKSLRGITNWILPRKRIRSRWECLSLVRLLSFCPLLRFGDETCWCRPVITSCLLCSPCSGYRILQRTELTQSTLVTKFTEYSMFCQVHVSNHHSPIQVSLQSIKRTKTCHQCVIITEEWIGTKNMYKQALKVISLGLVRFLSGGGCAAANMPDWGVCPCL